jgi:EAL domain-containing protein (putative c-di-GMP-specific phosphodiesterase class I)
MPVRMAVNLSAHQIRAPGFVDHVASVLGQTKLTADLLELELTEGVFVDPQSSVVILRELRELGVRVSIDDFGTGFSALNYLTQLPVDTIKIDRSFISQSVQQQDVAAVVSTVIEMAHGLGLQTVAEGVQTLEQESFLQALDCDLLQGFLHSPPLPALECDRWLRRQLTRGVSAIAGGRQTAPHEDAIALGVSLDSLLSSPLQISQL